MELTEIINEFVVWDLEKTIEFYRKHLGFELEETDGNPITWCRMRKNNCTIMFEEYSTVCAEIPDFPSKVSSSNLIKFKYANRKDLEKLYDKLKKENVKLFMELKDTDYGSLEFGILDPDNNMIILSC